ncbi:kdo(2)-lipid IV(A) lauroyltransferase [Dehalogenimonas formicexedens]|uniref:Kdo(2)-lipid IV(A) lauroyltransferase n=2 Tax=Dehalogenimonas TaxID=670486 RepID=A0A1P8F9D0_9CHLR|nr:kdo(2)-lipid IV(A) lauroyltransferase [Dehalogenimonas formicexedens]
MWKYYAFKIAGFSLSYLPRNLGYFVASLVADFAYTFFPTARVGVADNMRHVLGFNVDDIVLRRAVREVLKNTAKNYFDLIKLPHMELDEIERHLTVHGWQHLKDALERKWGVVLVTAHLGSFDIAAQIFAIRSVKTTVLVEALKPPPLLNHVTALRESHGVAFMPGRPGALESMMQLLRSGEAILMACDRNIKGKGITSVFFGEEATLPTVAVRMAMRTGAAIVPIFNRREDNGKYVIYVEPAIDVFTTGNGAVVKNVEQIAQVMERYIRHCPEQWVTLKSIWAKS